MPLVDDIRQKAIELLDRELLLGEFEDWFVAVSWDVHRGPDADAAPTVYEVERLLAEVSDGHRDEEDFRAALGRLLNIESWQTTVPVFVTFKIGTGATGSNVRIQSSGAGTRRAREHV